MCSPGATVSTEVGLRSEKEDSRSPEELDPTQIILSKLKSQG